MLAEENKGVVEMQIWGFFAKKKGQEDKNTRRSKMDDGGNEGNVRTRSKKTGNKNQPRQFSQVCV